MKSLRNSGQARDAADLVEYESSPRKWSRSVSTLIASLPAASYGSRDGDHDQSCVRSEPADGEARLISATIALPGARCSAARKPRRSLIRASARERSASYDSRCCSCSSVAARASVDLL